MKIKQIFFFAAVIIAICVSAAPVAAATELPEKSNNESINSIQNDDYTAIYRFYNSAGRDYVLTQNCDEKNTLSRGGSFAYEGAAFYVAARQLRRTVPLYRLLLADGEHFYTADNGEMQRLTRNDGARLEGILGYVATEAQRRTVPLYRLASADRHLFTTSEQEKNNYLQTPGNRLEGIAGYVWTSGVNPCGNFNDLQPQTPGGYPIVYSEQNFRGTTRAVERDFAGDRDWDGKPYRIRSIRVPRGWYLVVYEKKDFRGRSYNVDFDWSPTPDDWWYGKIRSIKVYRGNPPIQPR